MVSRTLMIYEVRGNEITEVTVVTKVQSNKGMIISIMHENFRNFTTLHRHLVTSFTLLLPSPRYLIVDINKFNKFLLADS
jgi:hypothetical protein